MTKTLICLKGNFEGLPVIQRARAMGLRLIVVDKAPDPAVYPLAAAVVVVDAYDAEATLQALRYRCPALWEPGETIDGVLCCCGDMPRTAALVAAEFHLPGMLQGRAKLSTDKLAQKTALKAAGLPVPKFQDADDTGWINTLGEIPEWMVFKPADSRGARGIYLVPRGYFQETYKKNSRDVSPSGRVVIEEYLSGPQLSTESIIQDSRVLFTGIGLRNYDRRAEFAPYIIEDGYDMPYGGLALQWEVGNMLLKACSALGWDNLTVKGDWIIHDGKLVILELAARLSGGFFGTHGIPLAYGYPFVDVAIELALGGGQALVNMSSGPRRTDHFVSQRYVFPAPEDIGRRVSQKAYISDHNDSDFSTYAIHPGDVIAPVVSHGQRWGQATCTGATPDKARERAERAVAAMKAAVVLE